MSTTDSRNTALVRRLGLFIAAKAEVGHVSYTEALTQRRLELGQLLAAALVTADEFNGQGRPGRWVQDEMDAARGYAAELLAIADLTAVEINAIVVTEQLARQAKRWADRPDCRNCGGDGFSTLGGDCPACKGRGR